MKTLTLVLLLAALLCSFSTVYSHRNKGGHHGRPHDRPNPQGPPPPPPPSPPTDPTKPDSSKKQSTPCVWTGKDATGNNWSIDLSRAAKTGGYKVQTTTNDWDYVLNFCSAVTTTCTSKTGAFKAMQVSKTNTATCYSLSAAVSVDDSVIAPTKLDNVETGGVVLQYTSGDLVDGVNARQTRIELTCDKTATDTTLQFKQEQIIDKKSVFVFTGKSRYACAVKAPAPSPVPPTPHRLPHCIMIALVALTCCGVCGWVLVCVLSLSLCIGCCCSEDKKQKPQPPQPQQPQYVFVPATHYPPVTATVPRVSVPAPAQVQPQATTRASETASLLMGTPIYYGTQYSTNV